MNLASSSSNSLSKVFSTPPVFCFIYLKTTSYKTFFEFGTYFDSYTGASSVNILFYTVTRNERVNTKYVVCLWFTLQKCHLNVDKKSLDKLFFISPVDYKFFLAKHQQGGHCFSACATFKSTHNQIQHVSKKRKCNCTSLGHGTFL